jgi:hypothetical protein
VDSNLFVYFCIGHIDINSSSLGSIHGSHRKYTNFLEKLKDFWRRYPESKTSLRGAPHPKNFILEFICGIYGTRNSSAIWKTQFPGLRYDFFWLKTEKNYFFYCKRSKRISMNQCEWFSSIMDDYRPIRMINIVRERRLGARWYFPKNHLPQMIYSSRADYIIFVGRSSSSVVDYHLQWMFILSC